ncbi:MAG: prefoldin subunit alpha [Candidatus Aenigmatarchaeota archaeon]
MSDEDIITYQAVKEELSKFVAYRESLLNYYNTLKNSLESLEAIKQSDIFLPIGNNIFIKAEPKDFDNLIVGIGSNIFLEMNVNQAKEFLERKIKKIEEEITEINMYIRSLQEYLTQIIEKLRRQ